VTLHSPADPWKEAEVLAARAAPGNGRPVVALGLGLGYHLLSLLPRLAPETPLAVVERDPEVWWAALMHTDLAPLLARPRTTLVVGPEAGDAVRRLKSVLGLGNSRGAMFFGHPPSLRAGNAYYETVVRSLTSRGRLPGPLGVNKEKARILVVNPDYFLIPEVMRGFQRLGHEVSLVLFDKRAEEGGTVLRRILGQVREVAPDLVFTVNHLGFDREGVLVDTLERLRIPSVSWYVDSPAIILDLYQGPRSRLSFIFVWDVTYLPQVKARGFENVYHLPLGTDPGIFRPQTRAARRPWTSRVSFVGNSLVGAVEQKLARLPDMPVLGRLINRLTAVFQTRRPGSWNELLDAAGLADEPLLGALNAEARVDLEAAVVFGATQAYRQACLKELAPFAPVIYGDAGWRTLAGREFQLRPEVNYYSELPLVYGASRINFNATSLQMRTAVNQRLFDVPAAGGFLLTDFREQVAELFRLGEEVICYRELAEIPELARFYLTHGKLRRQVAERARARILSEHTYTHRLRRMMEILRKAA
jgi:spore maturation protein CgeB